MIRCAHRLSGRIVLTKVKQETFKKKKKVGSKILALPQKSTMMSITVLASLSFGLLFDYSLSTPMNRQLEQDYGRNTQSWPEYYHRVDRNEETSPEMMSVDEGGSNYHDQLHLRMLESILVNQHPHNGNHGHSPNENRQAHLDHETRSAIERIESHLLDEDSPEYSLNSNVYWNGENLTQSSSSPPTANVEPSTDPQSSKPRDRWDREYAPIQQYRLRCCIDQLLKRLGHNRRHKDLQNDLINHLPKSIRDDIANGFKLTLTPEEIDQLNLPKPWRKAKWTDGLEKEEISKVKNFARNKLLKGRADSDQVINQLLSSLSSNQIRDIVDDNQVEMEKIVDSIPARKFRGKGRPKNSTD